MTVDTDSILREYLALRNMKVVAKKLGMPLLVVRAVLVSACGPLYGFPGLCRLYIYMLNRCFASAKEASKDLRVTRQDVYYLFRSIANVGVGLTLKEVKTAGRRELYLVKATEKCLDEFVEHARSSAGGC